MLTTLPMTLTLSRIIAIPVVVALFYVQGDYVRYIACVIYTAAAVTDYFDGYFARAWQQQTKLGRIFDPIADKLLVAATILMLVAVGRIGGWDVLPALVILCREVLVSGLREFLAEINRHNLPVSRLAKWKTGIQMTALGFLIVGDAAPTAWFPVFLVGQVGLWVAALLTLITGYDYLAEGLKHVGEDTPRVEERRKPAAKPARPIL
ncbi:MAG TPA: CDP-diacylglycerol--glycerol-3-phosphate 3-phosphatidyltransferase [Alphaproteobacteria bacterium]|nr:CDP-diacylglycerol--glycerol-3-phosphate 3-phosphatidyltransferase [Alphaproteobacteria bacterium]